MNENVILSIFILATLMLYINSIIQKQKIGKLNNIIKKALQIAKELQYDIHDESCSHGTKNIDNLVKLLELKGDDKE